MQLHVYFVNEETVIAGLCLVSGTVQSTALNHEIFDDSGKWCTVVEALLG